MVANLYKNESGAWSFSPSPSKPVRVCTPRGSVLRKTKLFGPLLFVPSEGDRLQLLPWSASQVFAAAKSEGRRFKFKNVTTGPLATRCGC